MSDADVVIIDSGGANLASLRFALDRLGARSLVSATPTTVAAAARVILPGVGAAADAMERLRRAELVDCIRTLQQPMLGICLGMQLLFAHSEEGQAEGLGIVAGGVRLLPGAPSRPVPHMGWNTCLPVRDDPLLAGIGASDYFYYVHSYAAPVSEVSSAVTDYGAAFSAVIQHRNFHGVQFHPERSSLAGARVLRNFLEL